MIDGLHRLEKWMQQAIENLSPARRKALFRDIGKDVRKENQKRITRQEGPDGDRWPQRKQRRRHGQVKQKTKMMMGLRKARRMALETGPDGVSIGYTGNTAKIASVHQYGGMDYVEEGGPKVRYPVRKVLGLSDKDHQTIGNRIRQHIAQAFR